MRQTINAVQLCLAVAAVPLLGLVAIRYGGTFPAGDFGDLGNLQWWARYQLSLDSTALKWIIGAAAGLSGAISVGLLATASVVTRIAGGSQKRLSRGFAWLLPVMAPMLIGIIVADAVVLIVSLVILDVWLHLPTLGIGAGFIVFAWRGANGMLDLFARRYPIELNILAAPVAQSAASRLHDDIIRSARKLGTPAPDHVLVGLDPTFSATSGPVRLPLIRDTLTGNTIILPLVGMAIFSEAEFSAILHHENAHFTGGDTRYSLLFQPIYQNLCSALLSLRRRASLASAGNVPARLILAAILRQFSNAERAISRANEINADGRATELAGPEAFAGALVKHRALQGAWQITVESAIEGIKAGAPIESFTAALLSHAEAVFRGLDQAAFLQGIEKEPRAGGLASHPTLAERASTAGIALAPPLLTLGEPYDRNWRESFGDIDLELSRLLNQNLISLGLAKPPRAPDAYLAKQRARRAGQAAAQRRGVQV